MCDPPKARIEGTCVYISLEGIIRESDIITCHVPLNMNGPDQTYHLINERILQKLNPDTILINTSRGEVVDNQALKQELKTRKKIQAAVLDVWENEPGIDKELVDLIDIASPHIAGYAADGKANATTMTIHSFSKFFNLPLTRWIPEHIPTPSATLLTINCHG